MMLRNLRVALFLVSRAIRRGNRGTVLLTMLIITLAFVNVSGGEQQRVAIARSLVNGPKILFADEPRANLDSDNRTRVLQLLRELCDTMRQDIIMVTHEMEERAYTDRVLWIKDGLLERQEEVDRIAG